MAIQTQDGVYVVVEDASASSVTIRNHADAAHRKRYKTGTENSFETTSQDSVSVDVNLDSTADASKTIKENWITAGYEALKTLEEFKDATNV